VPAPGALRARRDLQHGIFALMESYEVEAAALAGDRALAARMRPAVFATQRLDYKVLAVRWVFEATAPERMIVAATTDASPDELASAAAVLEEIIVTLRADGTGQAALQLLPDLLRGEIEELRESLACGSSNGGTNARRGEDGQRSAVFP
jgi:hypothetical protein